MARRLKLIVAYDGAAFAGWQSQASGNTIQDHLEHAFEIVTRDKLRVHGAGRTDAGVHALAQCAHADVRDERLTIEEWTAALNASLPPAIRVLRTAYVSSAFHARFAAKGKTYRYRIWNDRILPPLEFGRAWHVPGPLDFDRIVKEAEAFIGKHDFGGFTVNRGKPQHDRIRTIESVRARRNGRCITLEFSGDGFLYKMVRLMVGALVQHARDRAPAGTIRTRLAHPQKPSATGRLVAPAEGLFLMRVRY